MFGPSIPLLHQGRWTVYAQRTSHGTTLTLVGDEVSEIPEQRDAGGRVTVRGEPAIPAIVEESSTSTFKNKQHPFTAKQIEKELKALPGPATAPSAEVTK